MNAVPAENVTWRLEDLYSGPNDPRIESDRQWCNDQAGRLAADFRGKIAALDPGGLVAALKRYENLQESCRKLISYAYLFFSTQTHDPAASSLWQASQEFDSLITRDTLFFELEWTQIEDDKADAFLEHPELAPFRHYLESLRRYKPHMLSEKEEQILAEKEPVCTTSWSTLFDKVLGRIRFGDRGRTESEVLSDLYSPDRETRRLAAEELTEGLRGSLHILAHIFNTIMLDRSITDRLRSYPHWLRARNLHNEADDAMVEALVHAVSSRCDLVERYYALKKRLLHVDRLFDYDRYAPLPGLPETFIPWEEARDIVLDAYGMFSPRMADIACSFFDGRWIHAPVRAGKRSGAFSHPTVPSVHPYILMNYTGKLRDVATLAHELGHGVHQYLSAGQGLFNSETPLTTAESASVFGETLVFRYLLGRLKTPAERLAILCGKLEDIFATVFRQISMNRFEDAVHNERRTKGEIDAERLSDLWMETQRAMFGNSVTLLDHYRIWWSYIPHFVHTPGYVYAYAFGELLVLALYRQYLEDGPSFVPLYLHFLESGGRDRPDRLLAPFGIDLADHAFWHRGLKVIETLLEEAEDEAAKLS